MLLRLILLVSYFMIIFISSRVVEYSSTVAELACLRLVCNFVPLFSWLCSWGVESSSKCCQTSNSKQDTGEEPVEASNEPKEENLELSDVDGKFEAQDGRLVDHNIEFSSYENFVEHVEDTKASVWLVVVEPRKSFSTQYRSDRVLESIKWHRLARKLAHYGVRTGMYRCQRDPTLCLRYNVHTVSVLLTMPKGLQPKGKVKVEFYEFGSEHDKNKGHQNELYNWVKRKLQSKVATLEDADYTSQLSSSCDRLMNSKSSFCPTLNLVYRSKHITTPIFLSALSVRFTGRIKVLHVKIANLNSDQLIVVGNASLLSKNNINPFLNYTYGRRKGESFKYTDIELFLRTLYPEVNDIFTFAIVIVNMLCSLEIIIQRGGPLRRTVYLLWITVFANAILLSAWLPLLRLSQLSVAKPLLNICLKVLQALMVSDAVSMVREDIVHISEHLHVLVFGFICYGVLYGYLKYRITHGSMATLRLLTWLHEDLIEFQQDVRSLFHIQPSSFNYLTLEDGVERLLHRLSLPDLWLHPLYSEDFFINLPVWRFCRHFAKIHHTANGGGKLCPCLENTGLGNDHQMDSAPHLKVSEEKKAFHCEKDTVGHCQCKSCHPPGRTKMNKFSKACKCANSQHSPFLIMSLDCSICLDNYTCGTEVKILPCGHLFHIDCIGAWINSGCSRRHLRCPVCRWPVYKRKKHLNQSKQTV